MGGDADPHAIRVCFRSPKTLAQLSNALHTVREIIAEPRL